MDKDKSSVVQRAKDKFENDKKHWDQIYNLAREDLEFLSDEPLAQWTSSEAQDRIDTGRPVYTVDQLSQFVHQVANDIRMNTPSINIIPTGSEASKETAEVYKGLISSIQYKSNADDSYDTGVNFSIKCGIGFIRVEHEYEEEDGFNQELCVKRVINPFMIYIDSDSVECDGRDMRHANVLEKIKVKKFKELYDFDPVDFTDDKTNKRRTDEDEITISEYFEIEDRMETIALDQLGNKIEGYVEGMPALKTRKIKKPVVKRYKLSGQDILEETEFPGKYVPIVPVYGEEMWIDGKRHLLSLIRKAKDAQRMFNYWKSLETELLMKQPNAPVMVPAGSIDDYKADWINPQKSMALRYNHVDDQGNPYPQPQRLEPPTIPTGIVNAARETVDDIKATMGLYNASIGARSNETSGIAIQRRQQEGDVATFHFADNLTRSVTQVGRILVCAIPVVYDTPRALMIIGEEEEVKQVGINGAIVDDQEESYDLTRGKYDVRVVTGPSYTTGRQEAAAAFMELVKADPSLLQVAGDLVFKYQDFPGASALAARLKKTIPQNLLEESEKEELQAAPDPEKIQMGQIIEQGQQAIGEMQQQIQTLEMELKNKQEENAIKAQSDAAKIELDRMKLALESRKLDIEEHKVALETVSAEHARMVQPQEQAQVPKQIEIKLNSEGVQLAKTPEQEAMEMDKDAQEMAMSEREMMLKEVSIEQSRENAQAILNALTGVQSGLDALAQQISAPKRVVRNEDGTIAGIA